MHKIGGEIIEMIELVMNLSFTTNELVVLVFLVNLPLLIDRGGRAQSALDRFWA